MPKRGTRPPTAPQAEAAALELVDGDTQSQPGPVPVDPPEWLSEDATTLWHTFAPHTAPGTLTPGTASAFALYCNALATYAEADQMVQTAGVLIADGQGLAPNPALAIRDRADTTIHRWANLFGLLPDPRTAAPAGTDRPRTLPHLVEG
ncbi:P27 family phage terminase small subunit [Actinomadura sp. WMMA1423]|uniref:P27 family phage terminase small subunit n=1 Tax=Actinomadura sp. WMMA1423 TaxID=2591108 RepID=UPI0011478F73|nr:P27 family phage terminase small subunit [Actinomadura sp. WMMA1423]